MWLNSSVDIDLRIHSAKLLKYGFKNHTENDPLAHNRSTHSKRSLELPEIIMNCALNKAYTALVREDVNE